MSVRVAPLSPASDVSYQYCGSFGANVSTFKEFLYPGVYELGMQVPDGYAVFYSTCVNCTDHPLKSFKLYSFYGYNSTPLTISITAGSYVDLKWYFKPISYVEVPIAPYTNLYELLQGAQLPSNYQEALSQKLTCNSFAAAAGLPATLPTDVQTFKNGDSAWAQVGINSNFGGIGVSLNLMNSKSSGFPQTPFPIMDGRSSGGAGWQTSPGIVMYESSGNLACKPNLNFPQSPETCPVAHFNQSAGNSAEVWGFGSDFVNAPFLGLVQKNWTPLYSNDVETAIGSGVNTLYSPCYHSGFRFGNGRTAIEPSALPVLVQQHSENIQRLVSTYKIKALGSQTWYNGSDVGQAMYLLLASAAADKGDLRVYFPDPRSTTSQGIQLLGPVNASEPFTADKLPANIISGQNATLHCPNVPVAPVNPTPQQQAQYASAMQSYGCFIESIPSKNPALNYMILVWNVEGQDIAIAMSGNTLIDEQAYAGSYSMQNIINLRPFLFCQNNFSNPECGNVQWHNVFALPVSGIPVSKTTKSLGSLGGLRNGQVIKQTTYYDIGTRNQIASEFGFTFPD